MNAWGEGRHMTYQKDQTGILQSATKAAAELTSAEVAAGIVKSHDTIVKRFLEYRDDVVLPSLAAAVEADNAMFKAEEANTPAKSYSKSDKSTSKPKGNSGQSAPADPGATVIGRPGGNGKFDGKTVAEVFDMPGEVAADFGYVDKDGNGKPGSVYIDWMANNEKNPFMARVATAFLEQRRSSSDAA